MTEDDRIRCAHCRSHNIEVSDDATAEALMVPAIAECYDCGKRFVPPGTPPTDPEHLLMRTREGVEVIGTLEAFSLHYPPAYGSDYCEEESDCINAMFYPDDPSWDTVWAELDRDYGDMFRKYPYTPAPFRTIADGYTPEEMKGMGG